MIGDGRQHRSEEAATVDHDDRTAAAAAECILATLVRRAHRIVPRRVIERFDECRAAICRSQCLFERRVGEFMAAAVNQGPKRFVEFAEGVGPMLGGRGGEYPSQATRPLEFGPVCGVDLAAFIEYRQAHLPKSAFATGGLEPT